MNDATEQEPKADPPRPNGDGQLQADAASGATESALLLAEIRAHHSTAAERSAHIEEGRLHAERSREAIEKHLAGFDTVLAELKTQAASAKVASDELATLRKDAQTGHEQAVEAKAKADAAVEAMQTLIDVVTDNAAIVAGVRTTAEESQQIIAAKSQHIEDARVHADEVRANLDRFATKAEQSAGEAEKQHQASCNTNTNLNTMFAAAQSAKATADSEIGEVAKLRQQCEEHAAMSKNLADVAVTTEERIAAYEARLTAFQEYAEKTKTAIESLLPGAASAGLASAFNSRRQFFTWPQRIWQGVFIASIFALLALAGLEFTLFSQSDVSTLSWDRLGLSLLHRLPFALPLIWLAFHASHKAALAQRVEEDYAFKETVSRSFEGYRREMAELEGKAAADSALARLCAGVLTIITEPPGRIYEKHQLNATPLNAASESLLPLMKELAKASKITIGLEKTPEVGQ